MVTDFLLYGLARILLRTNIAHSPEMTLSLQSMEASDEFRAAQADRMVEAADRCGVRIAGRDLADLGCNDGALTERYLDRNPRSVIGLDIDASAIARAERRDRRVTFRLATPTQLPVPDSSVDVILSYDVFEHIADPAATLVECRRILRPGGQMLIGTSGWGHPFAPHLWSTMPVPWAHLLVSEATLLRACRRVYLADWYTPTVHDLDPQGQRIPERYAATEISRAHLNRYLARDFEREFARSGLRWRVELVPFQSRWAFWTRPCLRSRTLREYLHGYLWAILEKPNDDT